MFQAVLVVLRGFGVITYHARGFSIPRATMSFITDWAMAEPWSAIVGLLHVEAADRKHRRHAQQAEREDAHRDQHLGEGDAAAGGWGLGAGGWGKQANLAPRVPSAPRFSIPASTDNLTTDIFKPFRHQCPWCFASG